MVFMMIFCEKILGAGRNSQAILELPQPRFSIRFFSRLCLICSQSYAKSNFLDNPCRHDVG